MKGNRKPIHPKVAAGSLGGMVATVVLWLIGLVAKPPPDVAAAMAGLIVTGFAYAARHLEGEKVTQPSAGASSADCRHRWPDTALSSATAWGHPLFARW